MLLNLRRYRHALVLSQTELAKLAGPDFSQTYVSELERGITPRKATDVSVLARVLGVSEADLIGASGAVDATRGR